MLRCDHTEGETEQTNKAFPARREEMEESMKAFNRFGKLEEIRLTTFQFEEYEDRGTKFPRIVLNGEIVTEKGKEVYTRKLLLIETQEELQKFVSLVKEAISQKDKLPIAHILVDGVTKCSCGANVKGKFCSECGKPAPALVTKATCCGKTVEGKFCPECGKAVSASKTEGKKSIEKGGTEDLDILEDVLKKPVQRKRK